MSMCYLMSLAMFVQLAELINLRPSWLLTKTPLIIKCIFQNDCEPFNLLRFLVLNSKWSNCVKALCTNKWQLINKLFKYKTKVYSGVTSEYKLIKNQVVNSYHTALNLWFVFIYYWMIMLMLKLWSNWSYIVKNLPVLIFKHKYPKLLICV